MNNLSTDKFDFNLVEKTYFKYSYKKFTIIVLVAFLLALIIPRDIYSLRYSELRILWEIGVKATMILHGFSIVFSFINSLFTFLEFCETKKWNYLWFILSLIPILYWSILLISN